MQIYVADLSGELFQSGGLNLYGGPESILPAALEDGREGSSCSALLVGLLTAIAASEF